MRQQPDVLKMGMVGGGHGAFIGAVHRRAACLDLGVEFVAGALSSTPEKALASGRELGLADSRNYRTWPEMLEREQKLPPGERIDFVSIVTPNHVHFPVAKAFVEAGFHVVCDKPLVHTSQQAAELISVVKKAGTVFAVTYNYSGYPLVKQARHMVAAGEIGAVRKVIVEYNQGWLAGALEKTGQKQADWRTDPARAGFSGAIGDIGSHAEQLVSYVTGLEIEAICADLTMFVPGRRLDDDANLLLRFAPPSPGGRGQGEGLSSTPSPSAGSSQNPSPSTGSSLNPSPREGLGRVSPSSSSTSPSPEETKTLTPALSHRERGARGVLIASQIEVGHENDLRLRVFGETGSLEWRQEEPNQLVHRPEGQPERVLRRGNGYLCDAAKANTRLPAGHPEAFFEAFANIYAAAAEAMRARQRGEKAVGGAGLGGPFDYPDVVDGARGVAFIEKTVESAGSERKWTTVVQNVGKVQIKP